MEGTIIEISHGFYKVDCEGIIYNIPFQRFFISDKFKAKIGDKAIINERTLSIVDIVEK